MKNMVSLLADENMNEFWMLPINMRSKRVQCIPTNLLFVVEFWIGGVIGTYFSKNDIGLVITVYGKLLRPMIASYSPKWDYKDIKDMWY